MGAGRPLSAPSVGVLAADRAPLEASPALRHLVPAVEGGGARRALDLFDPALRLLRPPDPTAWLQAMHAARPAPDPNGVRLRVLTWNLALLDVAVGPLPWQASPGVGVRRGPVLARAVADGADLVLLQEVWEPVDQAALRRLAEGAGYRLACPPRPQRDGLAVLVHADRVRGTWQVEVHPYAVQDRVESTALPGKPPYRRSWLRVSYEDVELGPLTVFDTHMAPYPSRWPQRLAQARELGAAVAARPPAELVLVGGDLNAGAFYGRARWRRPDGRVEAGWWQDALSLPLLCHHGGLVDLAIQGRPAADVDLEVRLGRRLENDPARAAKGPLACDDAHLRAYTATDCNRLYFRQYAGTEQPARLDHLLARDPGGRIHAARSRHRFQARDLVLDGEAVEPSDHYGVEVEVLVAPR